jgi:uroporphyrin-III C-methyltransferase
VWLVGAGPGAADLLTLRAVWCLERADVVLHDRLVHPAVLEYARMDAERICVGKQPYGEGTTQDAINALLIDRARHGARVVRLKGGDPLVFGRGGEEAEALADAGVPFEIVPGVSSVLAAPAVAGIPLTHRGSAHSFSVATATGVGDGELAEQELATLAATGGTVLLLMAVHRLQQVVDALLRHGRSPSEPCAMVMHATWPTQRIVRAPLAQLVEHARAAAICPPAVLIIGPTAGLALSPPE